MKIRAVLIIAPLILLALALATGFVLMWRLFSLSVLMLSLSYLWTVLGIYGVTGQVSKSAERCQVGDWFKEEVTISNRSKIPKLLVKVQENTDLPGHTNMVAFNLSPHGSYGWQTDIHCQRRGRYSLGSLTVTATDPFGFFHLRRNLGAPQSILIYPATLELPFFQPLSRSELGYGPSRWLISEIGPNAARVREYINGDSFNRIHWLSTAHTGKLMVKEFDPDRSNYASRNVWIIADMHQSSQVGDGDEATAEYCITMAASLIKKYIDSGKEVGLIASGDQPYLFPPQMSSQHLWRMLEALAVMKATGKVPVDQLISSEIERFGADSAIIIITPSVSEETTVSLRYLKNRGAMVVAILLDPLSFGGTVSAVTAANTLVLSGLQVYLVRCGEELARALDSRALIPYMRYIGDIV